MMRCYTLKRLGTGLVRQKTRHGVAQRGLHSAAVGSAAASALQETKTAGTTCTYMMASSLVAVAAATTAIVLHEHPQTTRCACHWHDAGASIYEWNSSEPGTVEHFQDLLKHIKLHDSSGGSCDDSSFSSLQHSEEQPVQTAHFPSLEASLIVDSATQESRPFVINSTNPLPIETDLFVGTVQLVLKPLDASHDVNFDETRHPAFSIELQGHVKKDIPRLELYMGAQTLKPLDFGSLGRMGKRVCGILLHLLGRNIDGDMRYSFGTTEELPYITFPLAMAMDDIRVVQENTGTSSPSSQPVSHEQEDNRQPQDWKKSCQYNMKYSAECIDLASWKVQRPFEFPLQRLWGKDTPMQLIIYHQETPSSPREYLLQLQLKPVSTQ